jgi:nicotinate phosphoribosyltransferase
VYRFLDKNGLFRADAIALEDGNSIRTISHPFEYGKRTKISKYKKEKLTRHVMEHGKVIGKIPNAYEIAEYTQERLRQLPAEHKRFVFPQTYEVGISSALFRLKDQLKKQTTGYTAIST